MRDGLLAAVANYLQIFRHQITLVSTHLSKTQETMSGGSNHITKVFFGLQQCLKTGCSQLSLCVLFPKALVFIWKNHQRGDSVALNRNHHIGNSKSGHLSIYSIDRYILIEDSVQCLKKDFKKYRVY